MPVLVADLEELLPDVLRKDFDVENYAADTTRVLDLTGLDPDTRYGYVLYDRERWRVLLGYNRLRAFRTPPHEADRRPFQFALLSCHMPYAVEGLFRKRREVAGLDRWDFLGASNRL